MSFQNFFCTFYCIKLHLDLCCLCWYILLSCLVNWSLKFWYKIVDNQNLPTYLITISQCNKLCMHIFIHCIWSLSNKKSLDILNNLLKLHYFLNGFRIDFYQHSVDIQYWLIFLRIFKIKTQKKYHVFLIIIY